jgi:PKHD-type hydroxylase
MKVQFDLRQLTDFDTHAFFTDAFTKEECDQIKSLFVDMSDGLIESGKIEEKRKSKVKFIDPTKENQFIFEKFYQFAAQCNNFRWGFQMTGFYEGIQLTQYNGDGGHYDWHIDVGNNNLSIRKLSLILLLDDPDSYEGGEVEFIYGGKKKFAQGTLIVFPSYIAHKVHPVTQGIRRTAVAWISGEPYR